MLKKNQTVRVEITDRNNMGCGVGRVGEQVVFVRSALDGDIVDAKIIKVTKSYCVAIIDKLIRCSEHRIKSSCGVSGRCGGCVYDDVSFEHELELKRESVRAAFRRAGMGEACIGETVSDGKAEAYRNKAQYPVAQDENGYSIGFYASKTHRVIDCGECLLQPKIFSEIVECIRGFCLEKGISAYDEESRRGLLRHIYLRIAEATGQVMVCLVINGKSMPAQDELVDVVRAAFPEVVSIYLNINEENTNVVLGQEYRLLFGSDTIEDILCGLRLRIRPSAFYQVNRGVCEMLYGIAREKAALTGDETLLDLYCGIGSIGLSMARSAGRVVGVEIVPEAVECACENAAANGIDNAEFFCGDAGDAKRILEENYGVISPDVVVLDPPRKGCDEKLISYIGELSPKRIVYISCNPDTLARDSVRLSEIGYKMGEVTPVNMFPRTAHCEAVCSFDRQPRSDINS